MAPRRRPVRPVPPPVFPTLAKWLKTPAIEGVPAQKRRSKSLKGENPMVNPIGFHMAGGIPLLASGKLRVCYWKWPWSSLIYPWNIWNIVFFHSYVCLPEGKSYMSGKKHVSTVLVNDLWKRIWRYRYKEKLINAHPIWGFPYGWRYTNSWMVYFMENPI